MSLPLPNLDSRRWDDLVDEALGRLPRHAPEWTDCNASDPGITLVELLAYTTELSLYRANRVTSDLLRAFLRLSGREAEPAVAVPGRLPLAFRVSDDRPGRPLSLPAGLLFPDPAAANDPDAPVRLVEPVIVTGSEIRSIQSTDGRGAYIDLTRPAPGATFFYAWGDDPAEPTGDAGGPALVLGLSPSPDRDVPISIRIDVLLTAAQRGLNSLQ